MTGTADNYSDAQLILMAVQYHSEAVGLDDLRPLFGDIWQRLRSGQLAVSEASVAERLQEAIAIIDTAVETWPDYETAVRFFRLTGRHMLLVRNPDGGCAWIPARMRDGFAADDILNEYNPAAADGLPVDSSP